MSIWKEKNRTILFMIPSEPFFIIWIFCITQEPGVEYMGQGEIPDADDSYPHNDVAGVLFHHQKEYYENLIVRYESSSFKK